MKQIQNILLGEDLQRTLTNFSKVTGSSETEYIHVFQKHFFKNIFCFWSQGKTNTVVELVDWK